MDMIGRNEEVRRKAAQFRGLDAQTAESNANAVNIIGTTRSPTLNAIIERANAGIGLTLRLRYDNNISNLAAQRSLAVPPARSPGRLGPTGLHPDYHTVNDDADRINYDKMEKITRPVYQSSWELANK
jgi:hypothetical protein